VTRTAKLDAPIIQLDQPFPASKTASADQPGRPEAEAASPSAIDNELVSELESALQAVLTRGPGREPAEPHNGKPDPRGDGAHQAEPPADIWYGPSAAAAEPSRPLLLRPAELPEPRSASAWELDAPADKGRPAADAPRRRGLPLRAALCMAGVLGIVGAGGAGLMLVAAPEDEEAPLLAKPVRTETIRAAAAMDPQPEAEPEPATQDQTAAGAVMVETPAAEVTLLRPVGESGAAIQPPERPPVMRGEPQAVAAEATESVKAPDRLVQAPAPEAPASDVASGPQETHIGLIPPAAPPADGAGEPLAAGPSAPAGEESVAAVPTPLATEELVARTGIEAEAEGAGTAGPDAAGSAGQPDMQPEADLEAPAAGGEPGGTEAAASEPTRAAPVTTAVNMRAGPDNDAAVLTVIPAGSEVEVIACEYWCEVVFAGERGWIYKSFVSGAES